MTIPFVPQFEELLASFSLHPPQKNEEFSSIIIKNESFILDEVHKYKEEEIKLWYRSTLDLNIDSLVKRVTEELIKLGHPSNNAISLIVLGLYSFQNRPNGNAIKVLNDFLQLVSDSNVTQIFVLPGISPTDFQLNLGPFYVGVLNFERLTYRCQRAKSDFAERYRKQIIGKLSIERDASKTKLIDLEIYKRKLNFSGMFIAGLIGRFNCLMEHYFQLMADEQANNFWDELERQQIYTVASGAPYFNGDLLKTIPFSQRITAFYNIGQSRTAFITPGNMMPIIDFGGTDKKIPDAFSLLKSYGIESFPDSELHAPLYSYSNFVTRGRIRFMTGMIDEGFLHLIISLDLLFNEKGSVTASVSSRTAVLIYRKMECSYFEQEKIIEKLYDKRSAYVHRGKSVEEEDYKIAEKICIEVFFCLARLFRAGRYKSPDFIKGWHKNLDYLSSALKAGKEISDKEFEDNGIDIFDTKKLSNPL